MELVGKILDEYFPRLLSQNWHECLDSGHDRLPAPVDIKLIYFCLAMKLFGAGCSVCRLLVVYCPAGHRRRPNGSDLTGG
jgi:hypothetical protein